MGSMGGNSEPVRFAFAEATTLSNALRAAATQVESQATQRTTWATDALVDWAGVYAENFRGDAGVARTNAAQFVSALRQAATTLDGLATAAEEEKSRRDRAVAWQERQDLESNYEKVKEWVFGGDEPPPDSTVRNGESVVAPAPSTTPRSLA